MCEWYHSLGAADVLWPWGIKDTEFMLHIAFYAEFLQLIIKKMLVSLNLLS